MSAFRPHIGSLLLGYYTEDGRLHYAGRAGSGMTMAELKRPSGVLRPLQVDRMPAVRSIQHPGRGKP